MSLILIVSLVSHNKPYATNKPIKLFKSLNPGILSYFSIMKIFSPNLKSI